MASTAKRVRDLFRFLRFRGHLAPYLRPHRRGFGAAIGLSLLFACVRLLEPWPLQVVLDQVVLGKPSQLPGGMDPLAWVGGEPMRLLALAAAAVLAFAIVSGGIYYVQTVLVAKIGQLIIRDLREDVFHHLLRHSLSFHRRNDPGDLLMRLTGDMVFLREMILATVVTMTGELIILLSTLALMFVVSVKLTLVTLVIAPALFLLFRFFRGRMHEAARKQRKREGQIARKIAESLLAVPMIQSFTAESHEDDRFRRMCKRSERIGLRAARLEAGMQRTVELLIATGTCLVLWFGIREILAGRLTPGVFLVFLAYLRALFKPVRKLAKVAERTARASAAAERILEVLRSPRDVKDSKRAIAAPALEGAIRFDDIGFVYEDGTVALEGITAEVEPGEQIAIAGRSGAGKSTLFSLLLGFQRPTTGRLFVDGTKSKRYTLQSLRKQIAYLPQEPFVVAGTVRDNLLYGNRDATDEELWAALDLSEIGQFVRGLPGQLDNPIASRGQSLSGGQKQRLAIARAVLKDAPILLLDEPTTGLDPETEAVVLRSLARLRAGRTTLVIAHRPETVRSADRVWILDRGHLVRDVSPVAAGEVPLEEPSGESLGGQIGESRRVAPRRVVPAVPGLTFDERVRGVARLAEPDGRRRFLRELAELIGSIAEGPEASDFESLRSDIEADRNVDLRAIKQRAGQRALVRVSVGSVTWFVKMFRGRGGDRLGAARLIESVARSAGMEAPRTTGWIDRYRALVTEDADGTPWLELGAEDRLRLSQELGAALSRLHALPVPSGWEPVEPERRRLERAALRARENGGQVWSDLEPDWDAAVVHLFDERPEVDGDRGEASSGLHLVPIHGDVHPDQVRRGPDGGLVVLDWDVAGLGEAARDSGNVIAHIELEAARGVLSADEAAALVEAFLGGVLEGHSPIGAGSSEVEAQIRWHARSSLLRLTALYSDGDFGTRAPNDPTLSRELLRRAKRLVVDPSQGVAIWTAPLLENVR